MIGARLEGMLDGGPVFEPGSVWLVGAGPGDPGYLTVNAIRALQQADTILHDALIDDRILDLARPESDRIFSGKRAGVHSAPDTDETDWAALAALGQPLVLYMALRRIDGIARELIAGGLPPATPLAVISSATRPDEDILVSSLGAIAEDRQRRSIEPPAIVVVGDIVKTREHRRASLGRRKDDIVDRHYRRAFPARTAGARAEMRAGLHRRGVSRRGKRRRVRQHR